MLALTWDDIDFEKHTIRICKTVNDRSIDENGKIDYAQKVQGFAKTKTSNRTIKMTEYALVALEELKKQNGAYNYVVCNKKGGL